ncbi:hypothetical protein OXYTRIMIC_650 [Oxytricha trifallax]|uniref:Uncharacterized protein n=1 Tax=Oxytricha trifallax TaxID=1172189 RepID=A0A073HY36_9SPIT|nr:hypothetical protein OXYTRIMIC_650 [Oxytricha trifallax]
MSTSQNPGTEHEGFNQNERSLRKTITDPPLMGNVIHLLSLQQLQHQNPVWEKNSYRWLHWYSSTQI